MVKASIIAVATGRLFTPAPPDAGFHTSSISANRQADFNTRNGGSEYGARQARCR
jgi:hypothetical protein